MKKYAILTISAIILLASTLCSCSKQSSEAPEATTAETKAIIEEPEIAYMTGFTFDHVGIAPDENYTYSVSLDSDKAKININLPKIEAEYSEETDKAFFDRLSKIVDKYNLSKWDGFHKIDSTVNTIDEFSLNIEYSDDTMIDASGSCAYPDDYDDVLSEIDGIFGPYRKMLLDDIAKKDDAVNPEISIRRDYDLYYSDKKEKVIAKVTFPAIEVSEDTAAKYPELKKSLDTLSKDTEARFAGEFERIKESAIEEIENGDMFWDYYTEEEMLHVHRADSNIVSLLCDDYSFLGGAHGYYFVGTHNYDTKTGQELTLDNITNDVERLIKQIPVVLKQKYPVDTFYVDLDEYMQELIQDQTLLFWGVNNDSITFYFNPYDIAPYAAGLLTATIPFKGNEDLFLTDKLLANEEYISELSDYVSYETDLDGDGKADTVDIFYSSEFTDDGEFLNYDSVEIIVNGNHSTFEYYGFTHDAYFIHKADGNDYLYITAQIENDYNMIYQFKLSTDKVESLDKTCGTIEWFADPNSFDITEPTFMIGTVFGSKNYCIGAMGIPETNDTAFTLISYTPFDVMLPFEADEVNEEGMLTGKIIQVEAGDSALPVRTDNSEWIDLKTGSACVRVNVDKSGWPYTIDGVDIEEIFKGIVFAG